MVEEEEVRRNLRSGRRAGEEEVAEFWSRRKW